MNFNPGLISLAVLGVSVSTAQAGESDNQFNFPGPWGTTLTPSIVVTETHDDNIWLQDDDSPIETKSSLKTEIAPSLMWSARRGTDEIGIKGTLEVGQYHSSHDDDYVNKLINVFAHKEFNSKNKLDLSASYDYMYEQRGTGQSEIGSGGLLTVQNSPNKYVDWTAAARYTYGGDTSIGQLEFDVDHFDKEYQNHRDTTQFYDYDADRVGATFYYRVMPKTRLLFELSHRDIDYDKTATGDVKLDGDERKYEIGVTWDATAKTTGRAQVGRTDKDFDASSRKDSDFTSWEVGVLFSPRTYSTIDLSTSRKPSETNGSGNFIERTNYGVTWDHAWNERLSSFVVGDFNNEDYQGSNRDDDISSYGLGVRYGFRRGVRFGAEYRYSNRDSNIQLRDYRDNQFILSAEVGY